MTMTTEEQTTRAAARVKAIQLIAHALDDRDIHGLTWDRGDGEWLDMLRDALVDAMSRQNAAQRFDQEILQLAALAVGWLEERVIRGA